MTLYRTLTLTLSRTRTLTLTQVRGPRYDPKLHTGHIGWRRTAYAVHSDDGSKWRKDGTFNCGDAGEPYLPGGFGPNATVGTPTLTRTRTRTLTLTEP